MHAGLYDSQTCAARVALVQRKDILELKLDDTLPEAFFLETGGMGGTKEWKISKLSATVGETLDNATYVDFTFVMDRSSDYWLTFTIGPAVFLVVMSYGTFWRFSSRVIRVKRAIVVSSFPRASSSPVTFM